MPIDESEQERIRENLVAYLDGELDEASARVIEKALAEDSTLRREVESLTRAWELLDALPHAKASQQFTERTLASVHVEPESGASRRGRGRVPWRRMAVVAVWAMAIWLSAWLGFRLTHHWPKNVTLLLDDLPVIENLDIYSEVDDVEFLRELQKSGLFEASSESESPSQ